jgi:membrane protease YdiL (CAAX protease family)
VPVAAEGSKAARRQRRAAADADAATGKTGTTGKDAGSGAPEKLEDAEVVAGGAATRGGRAPKLDADGNPIPRPPYGAGALILAFLLAQVLSTIAYVVVQGNTDYDFAVPPGVGTAVGQAAGQVATGQALAVGVPPPLWLTALLQLPLWLGIGVVPVWFAVTKGKGVVADLGLRMKAIDVPVGLAVGLASQLVMVPVLYWVVFKVIGVQDVSAAARELTDRATDPISIVLVFLIVGVGAPLAEEIYFRGMAQRIFGRRVRARWAILAAAAFFAASHLQPLQFPALLVFGVILGVMAWRTGRLGPAIWAHVGFNLTAAVSLVYHVGWWS